VERQKAKSVIAATVIDAAVLPVGYVQIAKKIADRRMGALRWLAAFLERMSAN